MKGKKMKTAKAWVLVAPNGQYYRAENGSPFLFRTKPQGTTWRVASVEIREVSR